jgi:hypothetical protein
MRDTVCVQDAFGTVIFAVVGVGIVVAIITFIGRNQLYDQIGRGGLSLRDGSDRPADEGSWSGAVASQIRDEEIRQMLHARNERRTRRGEEPLDIETELAALTRPSVDPGLVQEVRELVQARNARRERRGEEPLDVEAEVERQLRELG